MSQRNKKLEEILKGFRYRQYQGDFFGSPIAVPFGSGVILENCRIPFFDVSSSQYRSGRGAACILTHECDIDPENQRHFNNKILVAPIIDFQIWFEHVSNTLSAREAEQTARDIVADKIFRVLFLPAIPKTSLEFGGFIYLNELTNTDVLDAKVNGKAVCSLTERSFRILSYKLENHLLRPKTVPLMGLH